MIKKNKILIIQLRPGLGDLCMFLPRCHEIAQKYPNFEITLLTKENTKAKEVLKHDPYINKIEFIDQNKLKKNIRFLFNLFSKNKFSKVFSYQYGPKYLKYIFLSKITGVNEIFFYGIFKKKEDMILKSINANQQWLNIKVTNFQPKIYLNTDNQKKKKNSIVIGLGASGDNKRWPIEYFITLIDKLTSIGINEYILAAGKSELKYIEKIKNTFSSNKKIAFISLENLDVYDSINLIRNSFIFIGNDTGFMHVSACLGLKTFCLYGDTPSSDAIYNQNIYPILPPGMNFTYHGDMAMNKILPEFVYSIVKKQIETM